jgi:hypothetical protein
MYGLLLHVTCAVIYPACYAILAWHAHRMAPEVCQVYWVLVLIGLFHAGCAIRLAWRRLRFARAARTPNEAPPPI